MTDALEKWSRARQAIAEAHSVDELKQIRDQAEAYRYALRLAGESRDVVRQAEEIKLRAERRAGELLRDMPKAHGARPADTGLQAVTPYSDLGIDKVQAHRWQRIADIPKPVFEKYINTAKEITTSGAMRVAKKAQEPPPNLEPILRDPADDKYSIIYADPPWSYNDKATSGGRWAGAENHYGCMTIEQLCDMRIVGDLVRDKAADDAILFMWVTHPFLEDSFAVIEAWGFEYKTCGFCWVKTNADESPYMGLGNYTRGNTELCLLGRRGRGLQRQSASVRQVVMRPRLAHSEKPHEVRERIGQLFGDVPRIELFARKRVRGWTTWGDQIPEELFGEEMA